MRHWKSPCFVIPVIVAIASLASLAVLGVTGWPGHPGVEGLMFCEVAQGIVRQPANTYSNIGFICVGLLIGWAAARDPARHHSDWRGNRMRATVFYPTLYAVVATFLGPASMALHASETWWGGKLDVFSMFLWIAFVIAYGVTRLHDLSVARFVALYLPLVAVLGAYLLIDWFPGTPLFGLLIAVFVAIEVVVFRRVHDAHARRIWLGVTAFAFAVAFAIWLPSRTGGPLCNPHSSLQGHALWHLLDSVSVGAVYLFYRSERPHTSLAHVRLADASGGRRRDIAALSHTRRRPH